MTPQMETERLPPGGVEAARQEYKTTDSEAYRAVDGPPMGSIASRYGATPEEWAHWSTGLGQTAFLLPAVMNPNATLSPGSSLSCVGKVPSQYNTNGHAVGIPQWTKRRSGPRDLEGWKQQPDYGICLQTSGDVRILDVDVSDPEQARQIAETVRDFVGVLPRRFRENSPKFALAFKKPGANAKRILRTAHGAIEFLANGQQAVVAGTHPSGARIQWEGGLPTEIPELTDEQFENLWAMLELQFAVAPSTAAKAPAGALAPRRAADANDPIVPWLYAKGVVKGEDSRTGIVHITCPFEEEHTTESSDSATGYLPAGTGGRQRGHFRCLHAHCEGKTDAEFLAAIGDPILDAFDVIPEPYDGPDIEDLLGTVGGLAADLSPVARNKSPTANRDPREEFFAHLQDNKYVFRPTGVLYSAAGVDNGYQPIGGVKPSKWLAVNRPVHQLTWHPGKPELIEGELIASGELRDAPGRRAYNLYRPPRVLPGDPAKVGPWFDHLRAIYPDDWAHLVLWFAHRVQRPGDKLNHALVLGGAQGIGKDSILEPLKRAVGQSNFNEIDPEHALGSFNTFVRAVVLRVNEARDLGNANDRFRLYERFKTIIAAPPDVLRINEKHISEYPIVNVVGVVYTTNHAVDGLYLPADDRRHFVAWSSRRKEEFAADYWRAYWGWLNGEGWRNVAAYLRTLSLDDFDPKADPPKTQAFYAIVNAGRDPEDGELQQALNEMGNPDAVTISDVLAELLARRTDVSLTAGADEWDSLIGTLSSRGSRRKVPHLFERAGYMQVANSNAASKLWTIDGKHQAIYARSTLPNVDRYRAAKKRAKQPIADEFEQWKQ